MPKTLAALPSNQYATDLELCLGKNLVSPGFSAFPIFSLKEARDEDAGLDSVELLRFCSGAVVPRSRATRGNVDFALRDAVELDLRH